MPVKPVFFLQGPTGSRSQVRDLVSSLRIPIRRIDLHRDENGRPVYWRVSINPTNYFPIPFSRGNLSLCLRIPKESQNDHITRHLTGR